MSFSTEELRELPHVISAPRFATYLRAVGNDPAKALALYQWNLNVSATLIVPLHICEVAIRNGVVEAIAKVHGNNWPWAAGFSRSLPKPKKGYDPAINLAKIAKKHTSTGKVVAELNFAFWEQLFTVGQENRLWMPHFRACFPSAPNGVSIPELRRTAYADLQGIRMLRDRVAHHEPIFSRNIADDYVRICNMIGWRSLVAATWVGRAQVVTALITAKPSSTHHPTGW